MTPEKALRWLIEFGTDWVDTDSIKDTWADSEIRWHGAVYLGYLERSDFSETTADMYKLTDKAIKLIEEKQNV